MSFVALALIAVGCGSSSTVVKILVCFVLLKKLHIVIFFIYIYRILYRSQNSRLLRPPKKVTHCYLFYLYLSDFKGTVSRDKYFFEGLKNQIGTFCIGADGF